VRAPWSRKAQSVEDGRAQVLELLGNGPSVVVMTIGDDDEETEFELATADSIDELQVGYAVDADGESHVDDATGGWHSTWLVIGQEGLTGDPIFVDLSDAGLPVFTAMHGMGRWDPELISKTLRRFLRNREAR
jgi:hypothetical protein